MPALKLKYLQIAILSHQMFVFLTVLLVIPIRNRQIVDIP